MRLVSMRVLAIDLGGIKSHGRTHAIDGKERFATFACEARL